MTPIPCLFPSDFFFFFNGVSYALAPEHSGGVWSLSVEAWRQLSFLKWNEIVG